MKERGMNRWDRIYWRTGLWIGKALKAIGRAISETGWAIEDRAAFFYSRKTNAAVNRILSMSDEEVLAITPPDEIECTRRALTGREGGSDG
jgi:hypothetical protein